MCICHNTISQNLSSVSQRETTVFVLLLRAVESYYNRIVGLVQATCSMMRGPHGRALCHASYS